MILAPASAREEIALYFFLPLPLPPPPKSLGPAGPTRHYQPFRDRRLPSVLRLPTDRRDRALISQFALIGGRGHFSARRARFPGRGNECVIIELALRIFKTAPRFPGLWATPRRIASRFFILPSFRFFSSPCSSLSPFSLPLFPPERTVARGLSAREAA